MGNLKAKHILGISHLDRDEIAFILDTAESMKDILERPIKKVPPLRGKTIVSLFFEPSTRTKLSFDLAAKRLSADTVGISASTSSVVKGETLIDTARNIEAMKPDIIVMRHSMSGAPHLISRYVGSAVINAGDGTNEHPSQALLDLLTVREHFGTLEGLNVTIIGDIAHSRVAHSDILAFTAMGSRVTVCGPATMMPPEAEQLGARVCLDIREAVRDAHVVMALRIQKERQGRLSPFPSEREYSKRFGLSKAIVPHLRKDAIIMHPGPINRGVEMSPEIADGINSVILQQVTNGVAVRMALFTLLLADVQRVN
ncbi:MAG: aspartate carbamoyltransferase [Thermodesulfatator sp.]|nr:MAG: aspartate carbamoyltransferase [Thermodesulfatator sp.]